MRIRSGMEFLEVGRVVPVGIAQAGTFLRGIERVELVPDLPTVREFIAIGIRV